LLGKCPSNHLVLPGDGLHGWRCNRRKCNRRRCNKKRCNRRRCNSDLLRL
jgi:hypothetical protein